MGRLITGVTIILFILVVNLMAAFIEDGTASATSVPGCDETDNITTCENVGKSTFLSSLGNVIVSGFSGAPAFFNAIWLTVMGILLTTAIILIVVSFIPTLSE